MTSALVLWFLAASTGVAGEVRVVRPPIDAARLEAWRAAGDALPGLRGFRAPILGRGAIHPVLHAPASLDAAEARAARIVAEQLARNGLRATLVAAVVELAPPSASGLAERLERIGLPVDLLDSWTPDGAEPLVARVARELGEGRDPAAVASGLAALPFAWRASIPGFAVATESGEHDAGAIRLQISSATDYAKPGEGGAMDVFRDLARLCPDAEIVAGVEQKHLAGVEREARALAASRGAPITLVESPLPLAQWAQDNAKPGFVDQGGARALVWIAPRYASRGEAGSTFVAGENLALEGLAESGRTVLASRLLFQGGDLMAVLDPRTGTRSLLVGEAEIARNRSLGLARDEVLAAFRGEFGVAGSIVLPAVSFHVDLEVSVRAGPAGLVACVLDTVTAARTVIGCGLDALVRAQLLDADAARLAREDLAADLHEPFFERVGPVLDRGLHGPGRFTLEFAERFAAGPADSGVGNLERLLLALDLWTAARIGDATAADLGLDPDSFSYLTSLRRRELDRLRVAGALQGLGWTLVAVPGLSDERRSLNPLNGLHLRGRYLQPAYGGIYAALDDLAGDRLAAAFGPDVRIERVATGETQRRAGGLHCAAAVEPAAGPR